jgi:hypothetical protein
MVCNLQMQVQLLLLEVEHAQAHAQVQAGPEGEPGASQADAVLGLAALGTQCWVGSMLCCDVLCCSFPAKWCALL